MSVLLDLVVFVAIAACVWWVLKPRYAFVLRIVKGKPIVRDGRVTDAFLRDVTEVCEWSGVASGSIYGTLVTFPCESGCRMQQQTRIRLYFTSGFPYECRQRLRNLSLVQH